MKVINSERQRIPIKSWCEDLEEVAWHQASNLANHPITYRHVAIMPDCHQGYGMPIGGVIACENAIIPNAVGVDIGCGMRAVKTSLKSITTRDVENVIEIIKERVPVGFAHHKEPKENNLIMPGEMEYIMHQEEGKVDYQIGTLGGGNHFIEIQEDTNCHIWFMIHSGSRNFGKKVCDYYNKVAIGLNKMHRSKAEDFKDLAFLPIGTHEARAYINEMKFALDLAKENRRQIALRAKEAFSMVIGNIKFVGDDIDIHHNYATVENHFGKNVWIHRKGATSAKKDEVGIIPGSMGTSSYIVKGLGNTESFLSCSHGAGRKMSRTEASRVLTQNECDKSMSGIIYSGWGKNRKGNIDLGEAPGAYKNIDTVINSQLDLIMPIVKLSPLGVIKG